MITRRRTLLGLLGAAGCSAVPRAPDEPGGIAGEWRVDDYRLGPGDKVRVNVFGEPSLTGEFQVSGAGVISLPLVGDINAASLTVAEFREAVARELRGGYLLDPKVSAEVLAYRPFYVLGEVASPGSFPYSAGLTVLNAIATAGGFTYRADRRRVFIRRANGQQEEGVLLTSSSAVAPGDTIRIAERLF